MLKTEQERNLELLALKAFTLNELIATANGAFVAMSEQLVDTGDLTELLGAAEILSDEVLALVKETTGATGSRPPYCYTIIV